MELQTILCLSFSKLLLAGNLLSKYSELITQQKMELGYTFIIVFFILNPNSILLWLYRLKSKYFSLSDFISYY